MDRIKDSDNVLLVSDNDQFEEFNKSCKAKHVTKTGKFLDGLDSCEFVPFDVIVVKNKTITDHKATFSSSLKVLKPGGLLLVLEVDESLQKTIQLNLTISGYIDVKKSGSSFSCVKPNYQIGSSAKINLKKQETGDVKSVWKIDDTEEEDLIDPDSLLDEEDLKKPDPSSLRVCSTTGKRKACKDCSCGLADELAAEKGGKTVDTANGPKSSCGSCYLGDAFRCAECPYLGMPAFKPGEKIQLSDNQLKADI